MVPRETCVGIRFSAELPGRGREGAAQHCGGQHLQTCRDLECTAVHTSGAAWAARVNLLLVVMLGTPDTSNPLPSSSPFAYFWLQPNQLVRLSVSLCPSACA